MPKHDRKTNKHHITPKSRPKGKRKKGNIVEIDADFHKAWHYCFQNMTVEESFMMIRIIMKTKPSGIWTSKMLHELRQAIMKDNRKRVDQLVTRANNSNFAM